MSPASRSTPDVLLTLARLDPMLDLPEVYRRVCELAAESFGVDRVAIWSLTDDRNAWRCLHQYERVSRSPLAGEDRPPAKLPIELASLDQQPVIVTTDSLVAAIYRGGHVSGLVWCGPSPSPRDWTAEERHRVAAFADRLAERMASAELTATRLTLQALDAQLAEARRMESLGQFTAGLAHDFKNLLTVILGATDLLTDRPELPEDLRPLIRQIADAAERGVILSEEITGHARPTAPRVVALADTVEGLLPLLRAAAGPNHPLDFQRGSGGGSVFVDPTRLERVLMNLVVNARDASAEGSPIQVCVGGAMAPPGLGKPGLYARIEVRDQGIGIPPENLGRIFDPFFTTKEPGHGTGLGLAIVRQVVDRAGGFVHVESEPGRGAAFQVYLPRVTLQANR